jgi:protoporphyrinogen oxidase
MSHVVVIGAGLGGLPTAYELQQLLPSQHRVTLISDQPKFTFIPGLVRGGLDKGGYPQYLAYDLNVGDLRGMYPVFIPEVQQAIQSAISP